MVMLSNIKKSKNISQYLEMQQHKIYQKFYLKVKSHNVTKIKKNQIHNITRKDEENYSHWPVFLSITLVF